MRRTFIAIVLVFLASLIFSCTEDTKLPPEIVVVAPEVARINTPVVFDASQSTDRDGEIDPTTFSFDFGDGSQAVTGVYKATHTFTKTGEYKVVIKVKDNDGLESTKGIMISIKDNIPPVAKLQAPEKGRVNTYISFDGSGSIDTDGSVVSYSFDFGDKTEKVTGSSVASHKFTTTGIFEVKLEVTDNEGATGSVSRQIEIFDNVPPVASFTAPSIVTEGEVVVVDASSSSDADGTIASYEFDFGDQSPVVNTVVANHIYSTAGTYNITLKVKDNDGAEATLTKQIIVNSLSSQSNPPKAVISSPDTALVNSPVIFDASKSDPGSGTITEYKWEFSDGSPAYTGGESVITHTFTSESTYTVKLTVTSTLRDGKTKLSDTVSKQIVVLEDGMVVSDISPNSGPTTKDTEVTITGKNFVNDGSMTIFFGSSLGKNLNIIDSTKLKVFAPAQAPGKVDVIVQSSKGSVIVKNGFTYYGSDNFATTVFCPDLLQTGGNSIGVKSTDDDTNYTIKLPFDFNFFGKVYPAGSNLYITTNGWLSFDNTSAQYMHSSLPSANDPATLIAPFFADLKPGSEGQIYTATLGSEPNRRFVVAFRKFTSNLYPNDRYNFEVILYESSNDIKFEYLNEFGGTAVDGTLSLIGIQDVNVGFVQVSRNTSIRGLAPGGRTYVFKSDGFKYSLSTDTTLSIYSHQPARDGEMDINGSFIIDFTKELNSNTLQSGITLTDLNTSQTVPINITLSPDKKRVTGTPQNSLIVDHKYRVTINSNLLGMNNVPFSYDPTRTSCGQVNSPVPYTFDFTARASLSQTINLTNGSNPYQIKHAHSATFAYIPKANGSRLEMINTATMQSYQNIGLSDCTTPQFITISYDDKYGYVSCTNNRVAVIDLNPANFHQIDVNSINPGTQSINVGNNPTGIAIRSGNDRVYVANYNGDSVSVIDTSNYQVVNNISLKANIGPLGVAVNNSKNRLYVTNYQSNELTIINIQNGSPQENQVEGYVSLNNCQNPNDISITPDGKLIMVTCSGSKKVALINADTNTQITTIDVDDEPIGIDISSDGILAYIANRGSNTVSIINISNRVLSQTISLSGNPRPFYVAIVPSTYTALLTLYNANQVAVIK
jgi:YVTN family beta-propeller protein